MFNNLTFILNRPQLSENIGACARAMKNFNFSKLVLVNPKPSFPNDKIIATSVGAKEIIKKAKTYDSLKLALKNVDYLISTTSRFRNKNIKHIELKEIKNLDFSKRVAFLFGSEASGLTNNDLSYSNYVLKIPCNPKYKSLNLSHSLIIVAQHVFELLNQNKNRYKKSDKIKPASKKDVKSMVDLCLSHLEEINFFKPKEKKPKMMQNLLSLFYRVELSQKETRILSSVFATLAKKGRLTK
ncbi:MAG: RNA methyltransferase [Candidatus Pelagibacter sp.]